uniref:p96 protein n=1 Tax=Southern bean mosaic virus TaxID=12139 RepID=Q83472_9VIRU|nr:p96 protein [Southern bean mosaic virus]
MYHPGRSPSFLITLANVICAAILFDIHRGVTNPAHYPIVAWIPRSLLCLVERVIRDIPYKYVRTRLLQRRRLPGYIAQSAVFVPLVYTDLIARMSETAWTTGTGYQLMSTGIRNADIVDTSTGSFTESADGYQQSRSVLCRHWPEERLRLAVYSDSEPRSIGPPRTVMMRLMVILLFTGHHVWNNSMAAPTALAKAGKQVADSTDWQTPLSCDHRCLICSGACAKTVWSKLGVKATQLVCPSDKDAVTCYGGSSSDNLLSGTGVCSKVDFSSKLTHSCPTAAWSEWNTDLLCRGVVGMHVGFEDIGKLNRGVNAFYVSNYLLRSQETLPPELSVIEIPFEDVETRSYEFIEVEIKGRGKAKLGKREFAWIPESGKYWADDDDDSLPPPPKVVDGKMVWSSAQETVADALNYQRAAGSRPLPPFSTCRLRLQRRRSSLYKRNALRFVGQSACKFRVCRKILQMKSLELLGSSQNCQTSPGPSEAPKQSFTPCYAKQESLIPLESQGILKELVKTSLKAATPPPNPVTVSVEKLVLRQQSTRSLQEERNRRKSTRKSSPGVPPLPPRLNQQRPPLRHLELVALCVTERLFLLSEAEDLLDESPVDLVRRGLCDPVRLFVKQEPHASRKVREGRFRLISSVSLVDQLVERMLFGPQNQLEIAEWEHIPSKPGMGLSLRQQAKSLFDDLRVKHSRCPAAEADISGFDWSVQDWELWADVEMIIVLGGFGHKLAKAARNRFSCFMNSVFQLSDGTLIEQQLPGIMKRSLDLLTNSRIRCLMAELIGSPWCIAMGDDSVEGWVDGAKDKYMRLDTRADYKPCATTISGRLYEVEFCSHVIRKIDVGWRRGLKLCLNTCLRASGSLRT